VPSVITRWLGRPLGFGVMAALVTALLVTGLVSVRYQSYNTERDMIDRTLGSLADARLALRGTDRQALGSLFGRIDTALVALPQLAPAAVDYRRERTRFVADPSAPYTELDAALARLGSQSLVERSRVRQERNLLFWSALAMSQVLLVGALLAMAQAGRKQQELLEARTRAEERLRQVTENIREMVWLTDVKSGAVLYASPAYETIWGRSLNSLYQEPRSWVAGVHPEDRERVIGAFQRGHQTGRVDIEYRILRPDGSLHWLHSRASVIRDRQGEAARIAGVTEDVTARKLAEAGERDNHERLRTLIEHAPAALALLDRSMRYVAVSERWAQDYGTHAEALLGRSHYEVFPEIPERWKRLHAEALAGIVSHSDEERFDRADGTAMWLKWALRPWHKADGSIGGICIFTEDITSWKHAQVALQESEERFRQIAENIQEVFWLTSPEKHQILYLSPAYARVWGRAPETCYVSSLAWIDAIHPDDRERVVNAAVTDQVRGTYDIEYRIVRPDGTERWIRDRAFPVRDAAGAVYRVAGVAEDITEQRDAQALMLQIAHGVAAETGADFFRAMVENLARYTQAQWVTVGELIDGGTRVRDIAQRSSGLPPSRREFAVAQRPCEAVLEGRAIRVWSDGVATDFPGDTELAANRMRSFAGIPLFGPVGEAIGIVSLVSQQPMQDVARVEAVLKIFAARAQAELTRMKREQEILDLNATLEQRICERTASLEAANRDLEAFSYSVSHDLRAPLRGVDGFLAILAEDGPLNELQRGAFDKAVRNVRRMNDLITDLIGLANVDRMPLRPRPVDLGPLARDILAGLREREPDRQVDVRIADITVHADPQLLKIALENLLGNAWKFTVRRPGAQIELARETGSHGEAIVVVKDNGAGFDPRHATRLFAPFQRLHSAREFEGTGIGLATVERIVRRHGGRIWADAAPGEGATFRFTLAGGEGAPRGTPSRLLSSTTPG
jgi:PAS domain S-box-containing protein